MGEEGKWRGGLLVPLDYLLVGVVVTTIAWESVGIYKTA